MIRLATAGRSHLADFILVNSFPPASDTRIQLSIIYNDSGSPPGPLAKRQQVPRYILAAMHVLPQVESRRSSLLVLP